VGEMSKTKEGSGLATNFFGSLTDPSTLQITYENRYFLYIRDRAFIANHRAITGREKPDCPTADRGQEPAPAGAGAVHPLLNAHRWHPVGQQIGLTK
jgi:hypothetical protein